MITFAVLLPFSGRYVPPYCAISLAALRWPSNTSHAILHTNGMKRDLARNSLVKSAIKMNARYIFFCDDDTQIPHDTITKLHMALETADDDVVACGGIYCSKSIPTEPYVYLQEDGGPHWKWRAGDVFPCQGLGTGCLMIKTSVFSKIPEPWFRDIDRIEDVGEDPAISVPDHYEFKMTDDLYFFHKVEQAGLKVIAHGGVLPVHWDQKGHPFTLPRDSYPMQLVKDPMWYAAFGVLDRNLVAPERQIQLPDGFLSQEEANELLELARGKRVLEMGAFKGRSTVCMALSAESVTSVDWHGGDIHVNKVNYGNSTWEEYSKNIASYPNITPIKGRFEDEIPKLVAARESYEMVFVDGSHDKQSVIRDMGYAMSFRPSVIAVHDWGLFEVTEGLQELGMGVPDKIVNTLAVYFLRHTESKNSN